MGSLLYRLDKGCGENLAKFEEKNEKAVADV